VWRDGVTRAGWFGWLAVGLLAGLCEIQHSTTPTSKIKRNNIT